MTPPERDKGEKEKEWWCLDLVIILKEVNTYYEELPLLSPYCVSHENMSTARIRLAELSNTTLSISSL